MAKTKPQPISRHITRIIIHCSATPNGKWVTAEDIDARHKKKNINRESVWASRQNASLKHIGYHFIIYTNGAVVTGRHLNEDSPFSKGVQANSITACLIGTDKFTLSQWQSLKSHITGLQCHLEALGKRVEVVGHYQLNPKKTCPNFLIGDWIRGMKEPMVDYLLTNNQEPDYGSI